MNNRKALLLGASQYASENLQDLPGAAHDVAALQPLLADPEVGAYEVQSHCDLPYHIAGELIGKSLRDARSEDVILLYFSGHGLRDVSGELYLAFQNSEVNALEDTCLPASRIARQIERSGASAVLLILDCCFSGAFSSRLGPKAAAQPVEFPTVQGTGRIVIASSASTQMSFTDTVQGNEPQMSTFTGALVHGLDTGLADIDRDGLVSPSDLFSYLNDELARRGASQSPVMHATSFQSPWVVAKRREASDDVWPTPVEAREISSLLDDYITELERLTESGPEQGNADTFPTGFTDLDKAVGGLRRRELTTVSGDLSDDFVLSVTRYCSFILGLTTVYLSASQSFNATLHRVVAAEGAIPVRLLSMGQLNQDHWNKLARVIGKLSDAPLHMIELGSFDVQQIMSQIKGISNIDLLVLDQIPTSDKSVIQQFLGELAGDARRRRYAYLIGGLEPGTDAEEYRLINRAAALELTVNLDNEVERQGEADIVVQKNRYGLLGRAFAVAAQTHYARLVNMATDF